MTPTPDASLADEPQSRPIAAAAIGTLAILLLGASFGFGNAMLEDSELHLLDLAILVGLVALTLVCAWQAWRWYKPDFAPVSTKTGKAQLLYVGSIFLGVTIGIVLPDATGDPLAIFGAGDMEPVNPDGPDWRIWLALFSLVIVTPILAWYWHQNVDELKSAAIGHAAVLAGYFYIIISGAWWIAWRGNLTPEPNAYVIFWGFVATWCATAAWRLYR